MVDTPNNSSTTQTVTVGGTISDALETLGDHDWIRLDLTAGQSVSVFVDGLTLEDSYLRIYDANGNLLYENDDITLGVNRDSLLAFTASYTGSYYIDVGAFDDAYTGTYQVTVNEYTPPPVGSIDQMANQLTSGYWSGDTHHFNVTQGGNITVNLTGLTAEGQNYARIALGLWTDVIGVNFVEVTTGGQIVFDDNQDGAFSDGVWSNGIISSATVNVSTQWLNNYRGNGINNYAMQTYIHEIGHALGLGHAGNYNGDARFPFDATYLNDGWPLTVMSYFGQDENTYYIDRGYSEAYVLTPMLADIVAMSTLYGLSTTTRTGNTTYGFGSNAGRDVFDASLYPTAAYTIVDSGGTDTLNYSGYSQAQLIDLNQDSYSNVGGLVGNVAIARGTVIENATGGSGNDTIIGNSANNVLNGGGGTNTVSYERAGAGVTVNLTIATAQNTIGAGTDTLTNFTILIGSAFNDTLRGTPNGSGVSEVHGGGGDDVIYANGSSGFYYGDAGDDRFVASSGNDIFFGGAGIDTADYSSATSAISLATNIDSTSTGGSGFDGFNSIERVIGSNYNDTIIASHVGDVLLGGAGNDTLQGANGASTLDGGLGDDIFDVFNSANVVIEAASQGTDLVRSRVSFTLSANVENLTLMDSGNLDGTGNNLANRITGNSGNNVLTGLAGDDYLFGGAGNDTLDGGAGLDRMYGGVGDDTYIVSDATDYAYENVGEGYDRVLSAISLTLRANVEELVLSGTGTLYGKGNELDNVITGNAWSNKLYGLDGNDTLYGGLGNDQLTGGNGADQLYGGVGNDFYYITDANDTVHENVGEGTDRVYASIDYVLDTNVEYLILTGTANLTGSGNAAANSVYGNDGDNWLYGLGGDDRLYGADGNDHLDGGVGGFDRMWGGYGDDVYYIHDATDYAYEFADQGHDLVYSDVSQNLRLYVEDLVLTGTADNYAKGNVGDNGLTGNSGANKLYGLAGNDTLDGGAGNDWLEGGAGQDLVTGGSGADDFVFRDGDFAGMTAGTADRILDFSQAEGDRIRLNIVDANTTLGGDQAFSFIGTTAFHGIAGELRYEQLGGNTYVMGDTNGDGNADFWIRLDGLHTLGTGDFVF